MEDKLVQKKKEILRYAKDKKMHRKEKYTHIEHIISEMKPKERKILYKEFLRDKASAKSLSDIKDLCVIVISFVNIIITMLFSFYNILAECDSKIALEEITRQIGNVYAIVGISLCLIILLITGINVFRSNERNRCQYIIDIFEDLQ